MDQTLVYKVDDRNKTTHTYDEAFAKQLVERIKEYYFLMQVVFDCVSSGVG